MSEQNCLRELLGNQRLHCIDVGARGGAQSHWRAFTDFIELDAFEPDKEACAEQQRNAKVGENWHAVGLSNQDGSAKLYVLRKASSSSLYPPNQKLMAAYIPGGYGDLVKTIDISVSRLSTVLDNAGRPTPNLVKLDVQGAELDVLHGLKDAHWNNLLAIQTEVEFVDQYINQALFWDVDRYIRERGYIMFDVLVNRYYRAKGGVENYYMKKYLGISRNRHDVSRRILSGDALYLRSPESILALGDKAAFAKMFMILCMYRCYDEAFWFLEEGQSAGIVSASQFKALIAIIVEVAPRPTLRQRNDWLGKLARRWSKRLGIGNRRKQEFWLDRSWDY